MTYSIINKSQLEGAHRLDAEYYQPEYLNLFSKIKKFKDKKLGEIAEILRGNTPKEYGDFEVPIIRSGDLSNFFISEDLLKAKNQNIFYVNKNDILISSIGFGSIGKVNIFNGENKKFGTVSEVTVIRNSQINSFYIWAFLKSKFGQFQINREITGATGQLHLNTGNVKNIILPLLNNYKEFEILYKNAKEHNEQAENFYSQAENLLLEELGFKDFEIEDDLSYVVNLSEIKSSHRADAEYFQPKYDKLVEKLKKYGADPLLSLAQNVTARFNPKSQPEKLFQYVELSNITSSVGMIDGFSEVSGDEAPSRAKRVLKTNDVILSSVEGSLGKVALAGKEQEGYLASNGFFQFRSKDILPEVLLVLAKSFVLQMQFEKETAGTILTAVPKEAVKNIIVPKIDKSTQQKIADLVQKSHEAYKKAKELLETAKQKVEKLIELI